MDSCDVLIVGGGPAGSSCAWGLRNSGLTVLIFDREKFPRDKVCAGWITPAVLHELEIKPAEYARNRTLQPINGFRTGSIGGPEIDTRYPRTVSYGIRRCEFDHYLLQRAAAPVRQGTALESLSRKGERWVINRQIEARLIIGAGGHFCPVARLLNSRHGPQPHVAAQEAEFELDERGQAECSVRPEIPELYFSPDMRGYGWCFRKGNFVNVGLGRLDHLHLPAHVAAFLAFLKQRGKIPADASVPLKGHAYLLHGLGKRDIAGNGWLLLGDAAGLAYKQSGEGIRPAIESGLLAAKAIIAASGNDLPRKIEGYPALVESRFGRTSHQRIDILSRLLPEPWVEYAAGRLLAMPWFCRKVLIDRWFLRSHLPPLSS